MYTSRDAARGSCPSLSLLVLPAVRGYSLTLSHVRSTVLHIDFLLLFFFFFFHSAYLCIMYLCIRQCGTVCVRPSVIQLKYVAVASPEITPSRSLNPSPSSSRFSNARLRTHARPYPFYTLSSVWFYFFFLLFSILFLFSPRIDLCAPVEPRDRGFVRYPSQVRSFISVSYFRLSSSFIIVLVSGRSTPD